MRSYFTEGNGKRLLLLVVIVDTGTKTLVVLASAEMANTAAADKPGLAASLLYKG